MGKSSLDYAELSGLRIALTHAKKDSPTVAAWIEKRIKELEQQ